MYNPNLRSDQNIDLFDDEFFDCGENINGILAAPSSYEKTSAQAYNLKYDVKLDVQEIRHRIKETQEKIDLLPYCKNIKEDAAEIAQNLQEMANDIFYLEEFVEIASTLFELANQTRNYIHDKIDPVIIDTYRSLLLDLERWLDTMFIRQDAANIHELDASIISSTKQILMFLKM